MSRVNRIELYCRWIRLLVIIKVIVTERFLLEIFLRLFFFFANLPPDRTCLEEIFMHAYISADTRRAAFDTVANFLRGKVVME